MREFFSGNKWEDGIPFADKNYERLEFFPVKNTLYIQ